MASNTLSTGEDAPFAGSRHIEALAGFCAGLRLRDLPARVVQRTRLHLLDTLGAMLAGTCSAEFRIARNLAPAAGRALLLGSAREVSPRDAALVNGVAAHVFELDDCGGCDHTGAVILPAMLAAMAEADTPVRGEDFLCAVVAGYEVGRRVLDASGGYGVHNGAGWHSTGTCGPLAAAAAVARLRGYDAEATRQAISLATSFSSGLWAFIHDGSQAKKIHAGRAAEGGLLAADLVRAGISGPGRVFDPVWGGFFECFVQGQGEVSALSRDLGADWMIERASLKPYAACRGAHSAVDAVADLLAETGQSPAAIRAIDLRLSPFLMDMCGTARLDTLAGAQMSLGYALAALVTFGQVGLAQYSAAMRNDDRINALLPLIRFHPDAAMDQMSEPEVTLTFADGTQHTAMVPRATGSTERPMPEADIQDKFRQLARMALPAERVAGVAQLVLGIDDLADCRDLPRLLSTDGPEPPVFR
ncbi:MmgE/PrpD family protein [Paracoccus pacificus]|uniref:MmgE/PrpD family protein n=1 Tax=Paracoccus pacificus TaxID=1463598 RepID=A0ABW4R305_9RHOB